MEREKEALAMLARELSNAKLRSKRRTSNMFEWSLDGRMKEIGYHIRKLRKQFKVLRVQEATLRRINKEKPRRREQNRNMSGTYGR